MTARRYNNAKVGREDVGETDKAHMLRSTRADSPHCNNTRTENGTCAWRGSTASATKTICSEAGSGHDITTQPNWGQQSEN